MSLFSFNKISFLYDFIEKNVVKDFQGSLDIINKNLILKKKYKVIDIGGGTGYIIRNLSKHIAMGVVLDPSYKMLSKIDDESIISIQGTGQNIPFKENTFDIILLISILHHVKEEGQKIVLKEAYRLLKKEGTLFIIDATHPKKMFALIFRMFERILVGKIFHVDPNNLKNKLKEIGFTNTDLYFPKKHDWKYAIKAKK